MSNSSGDVTFTSRDLGLVANYFSIKLVGAVTGISVALTAWTGGTGVPQSYASLTGNQRYSGVLVTRELLSAKLSTYVDFFEARFNAENKILDGVVFASLNDTVANINTEMLNWVTKKCLVRAGNIPYSSATHDVFLVNELRKGNIICHPTDWTLAEFMGIRSIRLEENAPITDYVFAEGLDNVGGISLASLPYFNTPLVLTPNESPDLLFGEADKRILEGYGYAVIDTNSNGSACIMGAVPTSYKTDALGNADDTFSYLNYVDTGSVCREYIFSGIKTDLAQQRLTAGDLVEGRNIQNAQSIEALFMKYYGRLADWALVQGGSEIFAQVSKATVVTLDLAKRTASIQSDLPIVTQLGTVNWTINMVFEM
jgi:hypothetical protein